jgi:hypothetical protein
LVLDTHSYTNTFSNSNWYPSGSQSDPSVYQSGPISVPPACGTSSVSFAKGGTFTATVNAGPSP